MQTEAILSEFHPIGYKNTEINIKIQAKTWRLPVTVWRDFPNKAWRQNDINVQRHVKLSTKNPSSMNIVDNFQKNGNILVDVSIKENVAHSNEPVETFLHLELNPKEGYLKTVWLYPESTSDALADISQFGVKRETIASIVAKTVRRNHTRLKKPKEIKCF